MINPQFRAALAENDDAKIAMAYFTLLPEEIAELRPSETARGEVARVRFEAERQLAKLVSLSSLDANGWFSSETDEAIIEAAWQAIRLGCTLPPSLMSAMAEARGRTFDRERAKRFWQPKPESESIDAADLDHHEDEEQPRVKDDLTTLIEQLRAAVASNLAHEIVAAAHSIELHGAKIPSDFGREVMEARAADGYLSTLRNALENDDDRTAGREWARISTRWPTMMHEFLNSAGERAFRRWGKLQRQAKSSNYGGSA